MPMIPEFIYFAHKDEKFRFLHVSTKHLIWFEKNLRYNHFVITKFNASY